VTENNGLSILQGMKLQDVEMQDMKLQDVKVAQKLQMFQAAE